MSRPDVTVIVVGPRGADDARSARDMLERYLLTTGFSFQLLDAAVAGRAGAGVAVREAWAEAKGNVIVILDAAAIATGAVGDAIALVQSETADVVFGLRAGYRQAPRCLRWMLVPLLPDPTVNLTAVSREAARFLIGESQMRRGFGLEAAYLANRYGFRVESITLAGAADVVRPPRRWLTQLFDAAMIRMIDRRNGYRSPRRCPICFSSEVWTCAQIPGDVIRACSRCKCRYRGRLADEDESRALRGPLRPQPSDRDAVEPGVQQGRAREKNGVRRLSALRRHLTSRARVLEVGVRDGSFGLAVSGAFEYVGIDRATAAARSARSRGLEVYCSTLAKFVNTGPAFDAVTLHHVFETLSDPHDALARIKELLKPGGVLLLSTFDTESLLFLLSKQRWMAQGFRTHAILYSRSALIELLEHSGFEVMTAGPELEYRDHRFLRHLAAAQWPAFAGLIKTVLRILPDPLLAGSGSIRIVARRRAGSPQEFRPVRSAEPTHAR